MIYSSPEEKINIKDSVVLGSTDNKNSSTRIQDLWLNKSYEPKYNSSHDPQELREQIIGNMKNGCALMAVLDALCKNNWLKFSQSNISEQSPNIYRSLLGNDFKLVLALK